MMETKNDWIPCYMFAVVSSMVEAQETARQIEKVAGEIKSRCEALATSYGLEQFCVTIEGETKEEIQVLLTALKAAGMKLPEKKPS